MLSMKTIDEHRETVLDGISIAAFAGLVLLSLATFTDYGMSWDETGHAIYGDSILQYFEAGMVETAIPNTRHTYGGGYNLAAALFSKLLPHTRITSNHLFTALLGLVGLLGTWRLGRLLGGAAAGLLALLLLATLPAYYGHMFNNPKDLPFAVGYIWVLYYLCRLIQAGPRAPPRLWIALALAIGLGMTVRIGGLLGIAYLAMIMGLQWLAFALRERRVKPALELAGSLALRGVFVTLVAWAIMVLPWPAVHRAPFSLPLQALRGFSKYHHSGYTLFRGEYVSAQQAPWDYLPQYFMVQLPDVLLAVLAIGLLTLIVYLAKPSLRGALWNWRGACVAFLIFAFLFPPSYAIVRRATIYDGLRHFLFVLPPLCVLAALAASKSIRWIAERSKPAAYATTALLGFGVVAVVVEMVQLHPYQYVYFNRMSGGLPAAATQYETEYYAHSFKEVAEKLADRMWEVDRERYLDGSYTVTACGIRDYVWTEHLPPNFVYKTPRWRSERMSVDFYSGYRRNECVDERADLPILLTVERQGVALNVLRDGRPHQKASPGEARQR